MAVPAARRRRPVPSTRRRRAVPVARWAAGWRAVVPAVATRLRRRRRALTRRSPPARSVARAPLLLLLPPGPPWQFGWLHGGGSAYAGTTAIESPAMPTLAAIAAALAIRFRRMISLPFLLRMSTLCS